MGLGERAKANRTLRKETKWTNSSHDTVREHKYERMKEKAYNEESSVTHNVKENEDKEDEATVGDVYEDLVLPRVRLYVMNL